MLTYRGVHYKPSQIGFKTLPSDTVGIYRGVRMRLPENVHRLDLAHTIPLIYRGVKYIARF